MDTYRKLLFFLVFGFTAVASDTADASVWTATHAWSPQREAQYSEWVEKTLREDIFTNPKSEYYGISTDCADAVYTFRILYSFENGLPFAIMDPTGGRKLITNEMSRWDRIRIEKKRLFHFINYISDLVGTATLPDDTYPVSIDRNGVRPGTLFSIYRTHVFTIQRFAPNGIPILMSSSLPRLIRDLTTYQGFPRRPLAEQPYRDGLLYFRQPNDLRKPVWKVPGFSDEQYKIPRAYWLKYVEEKLGFSQESVEEAIQRRIDNLCSMMKARVQVVDQAIIFQSMIGGRCMTRVEYGAYSTPGRDLNILNEIGLLEETLEAGAAGELPPYLERSDCVAEITPEWELRLPEFVHRSKTGKFSSDPNDSREARWGEMESTSLCPEY